MNQPMQHYTLDNLEKQENGKYQLIYQQPESEDSMAIQSHNPEDLLKTVNDWQKQHFDRQIAMKSYKAAIQVLSKLAINHRGSGAKAAAQVLLSVYNGNNYQLDLTDMCNFDNTNYILALAIIDGRVKTMREPQNLIENGEQIFGKIIELWPSLHIKNRWRRQCIDCYGTGTVEKYDEQDNLIDESKCLYCKGSGYDSHVPTVFHYKAD